MKRFFHILASFSLALAAVACSPEKAKEVPDWHKYMPDGGDPESPPSGDKIPSDMVLLYGGSHHRSPYKWSGSYLKDYVRYKDESGNYHYLFDGFLFLEFMNVENGAAENRTYITGYKYNNVALPSAKKQDWQELIDYYFDTDGGADALEQAVELTVQECGQAPETKRKVVIGIPEPITYANYSNTSSSTVYWGELNGTQMDFSKTADRLAACKWYVDEIVKKFDAKKYTYIELAGFYWVAEKATQTRDLMSSLGTYLNGKDLTFNWIPYYSADGFSEWKSFGFDCAYLQPNYFFNTSVPDSRLADACSQALKFGMGMEIEFDGNALEKNGRGYKLRNYMEYFKRYGIWKSSPLAYYQGSWALKWLRGSSSEADQQLYRDFCEFVISRPYRTAEKE